MNQGSVRRHPRWPRWVGRLAVVLAVVAAGALVLGGYADRNGRVFIPAAGPKQPVGALYISGDMGLRFDVGRSLTDELAERGVATTAISSPTFFKERRTRAELDTVIAQAVRDALRRSGADRIVAVGRSYGADVLQTGLADLPVDLRRRIAAVILVVPGDKVYFRSDPSTATYHGAPDSIGADTVNRIDWAPVTCIYGAAETDSLCPDIMLKNARMIRMPGGHLLNHDQDSLFAHIFAAVHRAVPSIAS